MCGIAGLFGTRNGAVRNRDYTIRMLTRIGHRGPDGAGCYFDDVVGFGTTRLRIIDIAGGDQPIGDESGRYWIAFNGEIYNYKELRSELIALGHAFQTRSDTEVMLKAWIAWGEDALGRLNGAFAAMLYDRLERRLILCRDRFGKRPLYYSQQGGTLSFASEIKCFLEYDPVTIAFDPERLASIFRVWTPLEDQSCFRGIDQVPPGALLSATETGIEIRRYAYLTFDRGCAGMGEADAIERTREKLTRSTRLRLRSDVDVGTYLSGGLDSAIVTSLVAENASRRTKSFSISFADEAFDESRDQAEVARHLETDHTTLRVDGRDIAATFPDALWHAETPVFRTAFVPMFLLSGIARAQGIKVVLTGEGADEAFLGYDIFKETLLREAWSGLDVAARRERLGQLYPYLDHFRRENHDALYAYFDRLSLVEDPDLFSHDLRFQGTRLSSRLLGGGGSGLSALRAQIDDNRALFDGMSAIQKAQWLEFKTLLSGYLLSTQGDRMALAHGIENRCPFLDPDVVAWGAATNLEFGDGWDEKYLLKKAFSDRLPARATRRPKQPFLAPDVSAFLSTAPDYLDAVLSENELGKLDFLDRSFCARLVAKVMSGRPSSISRAENQAFTLLLSTSLLHRQFVTAPPSALPAPPLVKQIDGRTGALVLS
jgi:asparagine synthase (glutamine-hydrolysing)